MCEYDLLPNSNATKEIPGRAAYGSQLDAPDPHVSRDRAYDSYLPICYIATGRTSQRKRKHNVARVPARSSKRKCELMRTNDSLPNLQPHAGLLPRCVTTSRKIAQTSALHQKNCSGTFRPKRIRPWVRLKHRIRDRQGTPRLVYSYRWQPRPTAPFVYVDTGFAGCRVTQRSTSGGVALYGQKCIRHWSVTRPSLALLVRETLN